MYIHGRLSEQFSEPQAAVGTTFTVTGSLRKAGTRHLKRFTGRIFTIVSDFREARRNFILDFLNKRQPKIVKTISAHSKSTLLPFGTLKKYSSRDTVPVKRSDKFEIQRGNTESPIKHDRNKLL